MNCQKQQNMEHFTNENLITISWTKNISTLNTKVVPQSSNLQPSKYSHIKIQEH